ncbi:hypothetical protein TNCV_97231 [Trichonephila clavipes]|nr:hypothetical protein TNCV_97231 [Trichonephila clavipes]
MPGVRVSFEYHTDDSTILLGSNPILRENTLGVRGLPPLFSFHQLHEMTCLEQCSATFLSLRTGQRLIILPRPAKGSPAPFDPRTGTGQRTGGCGSLFLSTSRREGTVPSVPSPGFEPRPYGTTVNVTNHYTGWAA